MDPIDDNNDFWWAWQESDERFRQHQELRDELTELTKELKDHESIRTDGRQVPGKN
jgi:hypothetical protein